MVKNKKTKNKKAPAVIEYDSDDERKYSNEITPNRKSEDYFQDDIDQFHSSREQILLNKRRELQPASSSSDEEEVLPIHSDSDGDIAVYEERLNHMRRLGVRSRHSSESEDDTEIRDDGIPSELAWGKTKHKYYGADVAEDDAIDFSGSDLDDALLEEQEALKMQKKLADELEEDDFGLEYLKIPKKVDHVESDTQIIEKDLSKLTKKEKIALLNKESPEFIELVKDCKSRMEDLSKNLLPVHEQIVKGLIPDSSGADFVRMKVKLIMSYCINVNFYLLLKAKQFRVQNHPVINRLVQLRNLLKQVDSIDAGFTVQLKELSNRIMNEEVIMFNNPRHDKVKSSEKNTKKSLELSTSEYQKRKLSNMLDSSDNDTEGDDYVMESKKGKVFETTGEREALEFYNAIKGNKDKVDEAQDELQAVSHDDQYVADDENDMKEDERRGITYQIMKNKGLTAKRKKEDRNPRVKHRNKFRKALIRRKGKVRNVRTEMNPYGGELSGIRAGVKKSIKLK